MPTTTQHDWRSTLTTIEEGCLQLERNTKPPSGDVLIFRGECDYEPARPIQSRLRRCLDKYLKALGEHREEDAIDDALWQLEEQSIQATSYHLRGSKPLYHRLGAYPPPPAGRQDPEYDQVLWKLQHQDGMTNRIDFTRSLFVALFFAYEPNDQDGSVMALTIQPHYIYPPQSPYPAGL